MKMPNFKTWVRNLATHKIFHGTTGWENSYRDEDIEEALKQAFEQGVALGRRSVSDTPS